MSKRDYYEVLGIPRDASDQEIKKRFRRVARELHPDVNGEDPHAEEKFKEAAEAYEVLSDPDRRATYDRYGHDGLSSSGFSSRTQGFGSIDDLFSAFFGGAGFGGNRGPAPGADIGVAVSIELFDVLEGTTREIEFDAVTRCEHCHGNGAEPGTPITACDTCGGTGEIRSVANTAFGQMVRAHPCERCHGDGRIAETPCAECSGLGRRHSTRKHRVDIPAGIESGQRIRIGGAGHAGEPGAPPGDLYVEVTVNEPENIHRDGQDLVSLIRVDATAAMLGQQIPVDTLTGEAEIELTPGTQPAAETRLKGQGLPRLGRSGRRGDHRFVFEVMIPSRLSEDQRRLASELDRSLTDDNRSEGNRSGIFSRVKRAFS